jgi:hypothetical protein
MTRRNTRLSQVGQQGPGLPASIVSISRHAMHISMIAGRGRFLKFHELAKRDREEAFARVPSPSSMMH